MRAGLDSEQPHSAGLGKLVGGFPEIVVNRRHTAAEASAVMARRIKGFNDAEMAAQRDTTLR